MTLFRLWYVSSVCITSHLPIAFVSRNIVGHYVGRKEVGNYFGVLCRPYSHLANGLMSMAREGVSYVVSTRGELHVVSLPIGWVAV